MIALVIKSVASLTWGSLAQRTARVLSARDGQAAELLKRSMASFAAADQAGLVRIIKRKLKKIQYRPHLING